MHIFGPIATNLAVSLLHITVIMPFTGDVCTVHVTPSGDVTILFVPVLATTTNNAKSALQQTSYQPPPGFVCNVHISPSGDVIIPPLLATATANPFSLDQQTPYHELPSPPPIDFATQDRLARYDELRDFNAVLSTYVFVVNCDVRTAVWFVVTWPVRLPPAFGRAAVAVVCAVVILVSKAGILNPCISPVVPVTVRFPGIVVVIPVLPKVIPVAVVLPIDSATAVAVSTTGVNVDVEDFNVP